MAKAKYTQNVRGEYATRVWDGTYNPDGTKHRINLKSKKSSADLEKQVNELKNQIKNGVYVRSDDKLFYDYALEWLDARKSSRSKNTQAMYRNIIETHLSFLESVKLSDIRNSHFQMAVNRAIDKPRTCQQIYITFKQIIKMAVVDNYIGKGMAENIFMDISLPRYQKSEKRPLDSIEKAALKTCIEENIFTEKEKALVAILYYTGLRRCEVLALTVFDFNFGKKENYLTVTKDLIFDGNTPEIRPMPKTSNGLRKVTMCENAAAILKEYISGLDSPNLFECRSGLVTKSSYRKMWQSIVKKMNTAAGGSESFPVIHDLTAHLFRHNYCSNLCYQIPAISIKKIAQLLGDTEKVVLDVYNHIIDEKEDVETVVETALAL